MYPLLENKSLYLQDLLQQNEPNKACFSILDQHIAATAYPFVAHAAYNALDVLYRHCLGQRQLQALFFQGQFL